MPGRPLRRARARAVHSLTDEKAIEVARVAVANLNDSQLLGLLVIATGDVEGSTKLSIAAVRRSVKAALVANPKAARVAVSANCHLPAVEEALGITRSERQHNSRTRTRTRTLREPAARPVERANAEGLAFLGAERSEPASVHASRNA